MAKDEAKKKDKILVLIGTYKDNQLENWPNYYNYPISDSDKITETDAKRIRELWLFKGQSAQKTFSAKFVGIKTREELIAKYAYPATGKAHGSRYLLFKITPIEYPRIYDKKVILRTKDFASSKQLQAQLKAYLESDARGVPEIAAKLPEVVRSIPKEDLCVCESALQLDFFDVITPPSLPQMVERPNTGGIRLATVFSGIGAIEQALLKDEIPHELVFACDNGELTPYHFAGTSLSDFLKEYEILSRRIEQMNPKTEGLTNSYVVVRGHLDALTRIIQNGATQNKHYERDVKDHVKMLHEAVEFYEFRVLWERCQTWEERKQMVDILYRPLLPRNFVRRSYCANYQILEANFHWNIAFLEGKKYKDAVDLLVGGSPCQSFSSNGKRRGIQDTRGTLFYEYARIVDEVRPRCFIFENVKGMTVHDKGRTWKVVKETFLSLDYDIYINRNDAGDEVPYLNAAHYGIPQTRDRIFLIGIRRDVKLTAPFNFPCPEPLRLKVADYQDSVVPEKYYLAHKGFEFVTTHPTRAQVGRDIMNCQKANQQFNWNGDFIFEDLSRFTGREIPKKAYIGEWEGRQGVIRQYTPRECLRLMGFPDTFKIVVNDTVMYRQCGNSIVVNVLQKIVQELIKAGVFNK